MKFTGYDYYLNGFFKLKRPIILIILFIVISLACNMPFLDSSEDEQPSYQDEEQQTPDEIITPKPLPEGMETVEDKWELWTGGTRLRGADLHPCVLYSEDGCIELTTKDDIQFLRNLGANLVNASYPGLFSVSPPYDLDPVAMEYLDNLVVWAQEVGVFVVIHFRTGPGRNESAIHMLNDAIIDVWRDQAAHDAWIEMWQFTAERYRGDPVVIGYNLMVEPLPNMIVDPNHDLSPMEVHEQLKGTLMDWNRLAAEITAGIREIDQDTPIIINSLNWGNAEWFPILETTGDERTVYSVHVYDPDVYTNQEVVDISIQYPDVVEDDGEQIIFDKAWLEDFYQPVIEFSHQNSVPIYVGEFGAFRWVPGAIEYLGDQMDLFEEFGWNYAHYVWRGDEEYFDGFNMELGIDPDNHNPVPGNPLMEVFSDRWDQNIVFANLSQETPEEGSQTLTDVMRWLYYIDVNLEQETIDQITDSSYDMVVIDFIISEQNNTDYALAEVIEEWHSSAHPKLVIAYIDIGQAENFRTYWDAGWTIGNPDWIVGGDPDGWEGNYPVAFWDDDYREIWLGDDGYLQSILDVGFDGVYLDWVEAYSDEKVIAKAEQDGLDARQEMIWWVEDIADFARSLDPDFIVISQNAAELVEVGGYLEIIDAISQEQVWFDGSADNDPPGDCPLPRTEEDVETEQYEQSLSEECLQQYEEFPDSTLHVSSEGYLYHLEMARDMGEPIFTIDYAVEWDNIAWVYETSRDLGFIPFVSNRSLSQYVEPYP